MNSLTLLKLEARDLYLKATDFDDLDCGRSMAEHIRPQIGIAREKFNKVYEKMKKLDPNIPENPFKE